MLLAITPDLSPSSSLTVHPIRRWRTKSAANRPVRVVRTGGKVIDKEIHNIAVRGITRFCGGPSVLAASRQRRVGADDRHDGLIPDFSSKGCLLSRASGRPLSEKYFTV